MITASDVAERLGLSVSTVGRALAADPRISEATKSRVRQAAVEMGYVANRAARMMRGAPSKVIGLVIPDVRNSFYSAIAHELSMNLQDQGFQLILAETGDDRMAELRHLRELSASRVSGAIIAATARPHRESVSLLQAIPHVQLLRRHPSLSTQWFGVDDEQALRQATAHLAGLGHTRIGYVGGPPKLPTGAARLAGFRSALDDGGLPEGAGRAELGPPSSVDFGRQAVRRLLAGPSAPTALVLGAVQFTVGALAELRQMEVRVPGDLSVVGFGDEPGFSWWGPGLTTITFPIQEMATGCALWLMHRLATQADGGNAYSSLSPGSLIVRGSTAPPARPDRVLTIASPGAGAPDERRAGTK